MREYLRFIRNRSVHYQLIITLATSALVIGLLFIISQFKGANSHLLNYLNNPPAYLGGWLLNALFVFAVIAGLFIYSFIDYYQHLKPLRQEMPSIVYTPFHYAKVVFIPRAKYSWKATALTLSRISLSSAVLLGAFVFGTIVFVRAAPGSLTVVLNQKSGSSDPNPSYTSVFDVVFSEAIDTSTFAVSDVTLSGTATGKSVRSITEVAPFDATSFEVRIEASGAGTIQPSLAQEVVVAQSGAAGSNQASTTGDNIVTYDGTWAPSDFVTTWKTDVTSTPFPNQVVVGIVSPGGGNYTIDWGDGNVQSINTSNPSHTYAVAGTYDIKINSGVYAINVYTDVGNTYNTKKIQNVKQWGTGKLNELVSAFRGASNLSISANDGPNLQYLAPSKSLNGMFSGATAFNSNINHWDTSGILDMGGMFNNANAFNQSLNAWDTSSVTNMASMFSRASNFNSNISSWDTSSVTNMSQMFYSAPLFNQQLNSWDTSAVTSMAGMFSYAEDFNQTLNGWNTSLVNDMSSMFDNAASFNSSLTAWNVSGVTSVYSMNRMFSGATSFNQPLNSWNMINITNTSEMFSGATSFNQPLNSWNTSNLVNASYMFEGATAFDQSLASWNVGNVTNMIAMFGAGSDLSTVNYDLTLIGWSQQTLQNSVTFTAGASTYCNAAGARASIVTTYGWTIADGGEQPGCIPKTEHFIINVKTDNPGDSAANEFMIGADDNRFTYDYNVDCDNDGDYEFTSRSLNTTCFYPSEGEYEIAISGIFPFYSVQDREKLIDIVQWGENEWQSVEDMFSGAVNLQMTATDVPNLTNVVSLSGMFQDATSFNSDISAWDVSGISDMSSMFSGATSFNQPLNGWDVSSVTDMSSMFSGATSFNQSLNGWDVSSVTDMGFLFSEATSFNQPLSDWETSNVIMLNGTFDGATSFNQPLNGWDVSSVVVLDGIFWQNTSFNQPLDAWTLDSLSSAGGAFGGATSFNQPLNSWNMSQVTNMSQMFYGATSFNQPLNSWNVSGISDFNLLFALATSFNQPLDNWNMSNATNLLGMFAGAASFDQSLASWDIGNVTSMALMFGDGGGSLPSSSGLTKSNYDATLIAWKNIAVQSTVVFDAGTSKYCDAESDRQFIIDNYSWTINDLGKDCTADLGVPQNLTGDAYPARVDLDWDDAVGADYYAIEYKLSSDSSWTLRSGDTITSSYAAVGSLENGTAYDFRVRSETYLGEQSEWSDVLTLSTTTPQTYYISDCAELQGIAINPYTFEPGDLSGNYILQQDIDCTESSSWSWEGMVPPELSVDPLGFIPLYDLFNDVPFTGSFDGGGFTVSNLYQNSRLLPYVGLFAMTEQSTIENVTLDGSQMIGTNYASNDVQVSGAGLVGVALDTMVSRVDITNYGFTGRNNGVLGGIIGMSVDSNLEDSSIEGSMDAPAPASNLYMDGPERIATDSSDFMYVTEQYGNRIQKISPSGDSVLTFGSQGSGDGQLNTPTGITVSSTGDIYVADTFNHRIQKFDSSGNYITQWGSSGSGDGQFVQPTGITMSPSGDIYVADTFNHRIQKFDSSGNYITQWGSSGSGDGQFAEPLDVVVNSVNEVFVTDRYNHRIQKFDSSGNYITQWGSSGSGDGQFDNPQGIAIDQSDNVYVRDYYNYSIQKFDSGGTFVTKWGSFGSDCTGTLDGASGIALDSLGNILTPIKGGGCIQKFDSGGTFVTKWGTDISQRSDFFGYGGLIGMADPDDSTVQTTISKSYADVDLSADVENSHEVTLIGGASAGIMVDINNSYVAGSINIDGQSSAETFMMAGGLVGQHIGSITNSYSATNIDIQDFESPMSTVGGLVGMVYPMVPITISSSFAVGTVNIVTAGTVPPGALLGGVYATGEEVNLINGYYDQSTTGQAECVGAFLDQNMSPVAAPETISCTSVNADGLQSSYFHNNNSQPPLNDWDFDSIWKTNPTTTPTFVGGEAPAPTTPGSPRNLVASGPTGTSIDLTWLVPSSTGNSPITDYTVQYKLSSSGTWLTFVDGVGTSTSATVTGLVQSSSYDFRVAATNAIGQGSFTSDVTSSTLGVPSIPRAFSGETAGATSASLGWTSPLSDGGSAITDYTVQYKLSSSGTWLTFADGTSTSLSATVTSLQTNQAYDFRVAAVNSIGQGAFATISGIQIESLLPSAPVNLTASNTDGSGAALGWQVPLSGEPFIDYTVQYKLSSSGTWLTYNDGEATNTTAVLTGLVNGENYDFRVAASNALGQGEWSNVASLQLLQMVGDCEELYQELSSNLNGHFGLANDIDCSDTVNWNDGAGWDPIGAGGPAQTFTGTLDGVGNTISGLFIDNANSEAVGMFEFIENATIKNISFSGGSVTANEYLSLNGSSVGMVAGGILDDADIVNVQSDVSIVNNRGNTNGGDHTGGLVGYILFSSNTTNPVRFVNSSVSADISFGSIAGGLIGSAVVDGLPTNALAEDIPTTTLISIADSFVTGNITSKNSSGGIIGASVGSSIEVVNSYSTGDVTTNEPNTGVGYAGGIIGFAPPQTARVKLDDVYSTGNILMDQGFMTAQAGGLAGAIVSGSAFYDGLPSTLLDTAGLIVNDSYATGSITNDTGATNSLGGIVGLAQFASISGSHYAGAIDGKTTNGNSGSNIVTGGLVAQGGAIMIDNSYAQVELNAYLDGPRKLSMEGGLLGGSIWADIRNSHTSGSIVSDQANPCTDTDCYNSASHVGGIVGALSLSNIPSDQVAEESFVKDTYSSMSIELNGPRSPSEGGTGGLIGSIAAMRDNLTTLSYATASGDIALDNTGPQASTGGLVGTILSRSDPRVELFRTSATGSITMSNLADQSSSHPLVPFGLTGGGGLVGLFSGGGSISESFATGNIDGGVNSGGLVGQAYAASLLDDSDPLVQDLTIEDSFARGNISTKQWLGNIDEEAIAADAAGGLVGKFAGTSISNSYAAGNVVSTAENPVGYLGHPSLDVLYRYGHSGGLVGTMTGAISNSFFYGNVSGMNNDYVGNLVGVGTLISPGDTFDLVVNNSYYDLGRSEAQRCANKFNFSGDFNNPDSVGITEYQSGCNGVNGENTQQDYFINNSCSPPLNTWDFTSVWRVQRSDAPSFVSDPNANPRSCEPTPPNEPASPSVDVSSPISPQPRTQRSPQPSTTQNGPMQLAPDIRPDFSPEPAKVFSENKARDWQVLVRSIPWLLIAIILLLAGLHGRRAFTEYRKIVVLTRIINRYKNTLQATQEFIAVANHYLNTPLAIMSGITELLVSQGMMLKPTATNLRNHLQGLKTATEQIMSQSIASPGVASTTATISVVYPQKPWRSRAVILPLVIVAICLGVVEVLLLNAPYVDHDIFQVGIQIFVFIVAAALLVFGYHYREVLHAKLVATEKAVSAEAQLVEIRKAFIARIAATLDTFVIRLQNDSTSLKGETRAVPFFNGLAMLEKVTTSVNHVDQFSQTTSGLPSVNATDIITKTVDSYRQIAATRSITLKLNPSNPVWIQAEPRQLQHLFGSVLDNAVKFSNEGGNVVIDIKQAGKKVKIQVKDQGIGIESEKLARLFTPFTRATSTEQYNYEGLGLDLFVDRIIARNLGGDIRITSTVNEWTQVDIQLAATKR